MILKRNNFNNLLYVKGRTCTPGYVGLYLLLYSIIQLNWQAAIFSFVMSLLYISDKDIRYLMSKSLMFRKDLYFSSLLSISVFLVGLTFDIRSKLVFLVITVLAMRHIYIAVKILAKGVWNKKQGTYTLRKAGGNVVENAVGEQLNTLQTKGTGTLGNQILKEDVEDDKK